LSRNSLTSGNGSQDEKWLGPRGHCIGQWRVRRFMGDILFAGEEPQKRPTLLRDLVAYGAAQHRKAGFERVEDRALSGLTLDLQLHIAAYMRQCPQM